MAALKYWVWLTTLPGLGERAKLQLLAHFGSPEEIYFAPEGELCWQRALRNYRPPCWRTNRWTGRRRCWRTVPKTASSC